jgi:hypothetical protein
VRWLSGQCGISQTYRPPQPVTFLPQYWYIDCIEYVHTENCIAIDYVCLKSQLFLSIYSAVGIGTGCGLNEQGSGFEYRVIQTSSVAHSARREADYSPPTSAKVKRTWIDNSLPSMSSLLSA